MEKWRGFGFGTRSIEYIENWALESGLKGIRLTVNKKNSNAIRVYEKNGFDTIDHVVMDIGGGFVMDDYVMRKKVK